MASFGSLQGDNEKDAGDEAKDARHKCSSATLVSGQACAVFASSARLRRSKADLRDNDPEEIRIVIIGKTGNGKSATANTILGVNSLDQMYGFQEFCGQSSGTTVSNMHAVDINGQTVRVIDTPGVCDTHRDEREVLFEISKCLVYASPGPHVVLFVVSSTARFTKEEMDAFDKLRKLFDSSLTKYICVVFTHGESLKHGMVSLEENLDKSRTATQEAKVHGRETPDINTILRQVGKRYLLFSNSNAVDQDTKDGQVLKLLEMIRNIEHGNSCPYFTDETTRQVTAMKQGRIRQIMAEKHVKESTAFKILLEEVDSATTRTETVKRGLIGLGTGVLLGGIATLLTRGAALPMIAGGAALGGLSGAFSKCSLM